jgi:hypothetical protein
MVVMPVEKPPSTSCSIVSFHHLDDSNIVSREEVTVEKGPEKKEILGTPFPPAGKRIQTI